MTSDLIQAVGYFLAFYETDLNYIKSFHDYKKRHNRSYFDKSGYSLPSFLAEFKVARNISKDKGEMLLEVAQSGFIRKGSKKVGQFAEAIQESGISNGKLTVSLASKVLFLNSPDTVMPFDSRTRRAVQSRNNEYSEFLQLIDEFRERDKNDVQLCLKTIRPHARAIEGKFKDLKYLNLITVRENRMLDKLLWVKGRKLS